jgi:hypothetical protein
MVGVPLGLQTSSPALAVDTPGNVNSATLKSGVQPLAPFGQGLSFDSISSKALAAHWNSLGVPGQLLSVVLIDPVESRMMTTFHGSGLPTIDAVATALTVRVFFPKSGIKYAGIVAVSFTCTAFTGLELVVHELPDGSNDFRHSGVIVGVAVPAKALAFSSPDPVL